jgi:hypothetical protein|tara:strand:- start:1055 stop:1516 length:462 start_codon:yes stop_codon:yes gene_type:complete
MAIGNLLAGSDQQYTALKDETGTWRILDTWHEDLKHLDGEDEIPDTSDAVVVFSEGQFIALIKEAGRLGILANATFGSNEYEDEERHSEADATFIENEDTLHVLHTQLDELKTENAHLIKQSAHSEEYELKEHALNSILKLVSMQDMANLSKD